MTNQKLRIGLLIDDYDMPLWAYEMIKEINMSDYAEITLVVRKSVAKTKEASFLSKLWLLRKQILFSLLIKAEAKMYATTPDAFEIKNTKEIVNSPEILVTPIQTKFSDTITKEDNAKIAEYNIDVFIRFGFAILRGEILTVAKYGVWSYHHGDNKVNRGGPAGVWEVLEGWNETGVVLQILTEDLDGGVKIQESFSCTDNISIKRNKNSFYWKAKSFIPRQLKKLHTIGERSFFEQIKKTNAHPFFYCNRLYLTPTNLETLSAISRKYWNKAKEKISSLFYLNQWILLFKLEKTNVISQSFFRFKRIIPPLDRFWADPFIIERAGTYFIFIEELIYAEDKGKIAVIEMDAKGSYKKPYVVLEKEYHLSYPFLFEEEGNIFMIPETSQNNTIELYRCVEFPGTWELEKILMKNVEAVDTTIFKHEETYWLFTNIKENPGSSSNDELFLFYSDDLLKGEWTPHPENPIVSDVRTARSAGNIFVHDGRIYRPAQNCSKYYGYGMQIKEIVTLSKTEYEETWIQSIDPNWATDLRATHTLNFSGRLTMIDAIIKRRK